MVQGTIKEDINVSYFEEMLTKYVSEHHLLHKYSRKDVKERALLAAEEFETERLHGLSVDEALEAANQTLYTDIPASLYDIFSDIIEDIYNGSLNPHESDMLVAELLGEFESDYADYNFSDEFMDSQEGVSVMSEIEEKIKLYLSKEYGI